MKKQSGAKIIAFLALFGILIGVVGTGILIIFSGNNASTNTSNITSEDLQEIINKSKITEDKTLTGTQNN